MLVYLLCAAGSYTNNKPAGEVIVKLRRPETILWYNPVIFRKTSIIWYMYYFESQVISDNGWGHLLMSDISCQPGLLSLTSGDGSPHSHTN